MSCSVLGTIEFKSSQRKARGLGSNKGAYMITNTIVGVPYYNCNIIYSKPYSNHLGPYNISTIVTLIVAPLKEPILIIKAPILGPRMKCLGLRLRAFASYLRPCRYEGEEAAKPQIQHLTYHRGLNNFPYCFGASFFKL